MKKDENAGISNEQLRIIQGKLRESLLEEIRALDPGVIGEMTLKVDSGSRMFSDWHDVFRDNGTFTDGFGKAGGRAAEIKQTFGPNTKAGG